ncbi:MAG: TadE/TadG family type IV pilus assembly protein [Anaerolineales bacterium]
MRIKKITCETRGQSIIELALVLPVLVLLIVGMVEAVLICRTYLALLDSSYQGAHLGSQGLFRYDNNEIYTLVTQKLTEEGCNTSELVDVIITRANLVGGKGIQDYQVVNMKGSGRESIFNPTIIGNRLRGTDPSGRIIIVEIVYDHILLFDYPFTEKLFPNPFPLVSYSIQYVQRQ